MTTDSKDKVDGASDLEQLDGLLALHRRGIELDLRVAAPATVLSFNPITRRADVTLAFLPVIYVEDEEVPQPPIVCPQVPVLMQGEALSYVTTPILPGATGLVVFADRCLAKFLTDGVPGDPINGRTHSLGDGLFIPCPIGPAVAPVDPTGTVVEGVLVKLGAAATQPAVLGTAYAAAFSAHAAAVSSAAATLATAAGVWAGAGGLAGATAITFANAVAAFCTAVAAANTALAAALAATLSAKVLVQ